MLKYYPNRIITNNLLMHSILSELDKVIQSDSPILLMGETGVGKELFADYIHNYSPRNNRPFVKVGLASLPRELIESELFGHTKEAYTGASTDKKGFFELANNGSIFLDDIDDFPIDLQPKLLRVLESGEIMQIGGQSPIQVDVRLVTSSKIDLKKAVENGLFRADLFYRINVIPVNIPPLRDRKDDIPLLINEFLNEFSRDKQIDLDDDAMEAFINYNWPGNVRELKNLFRRLVLLSDGKINMMDLPTELTNNDQSENLIRNCERCFMNNSMSFDNVMDCLEINLIKYAVSKSEGNVTKAARLLKLNRSTLRDKIQNHHGLN